MSLALSTAKSLDFILETITPRERVYVEARIQGSVPVAAARVAGYDDPSEAAARLESSENVRLAVEYSIRNHIHRANYTREDITRGFEDSIRLATTAAEMIMGYKEIAKLHGLYAPEKKELQITAQVISSASDEELAKAAAIDGDFVVLSNEEPSTENQLQIEETP